MPLRGHLLAARPYMIKFNVILFEMLQENGCEPILDVTPMEPKNIRFTQFAPPREREILGFVTTCKVGAALGCPWFYLIFFRRKKKQNFEVISEFQNILMILGAKLS